ncbi:MAG: ribonucleotide-diphosphate reductase subunit beta [Deltaproteobacteria bacterium]|nr:ribonucleotide-diphosphate reductase subunit beta [Deltaproteobacteria bacterium]
MRENFGGENYTGEDKRNIFLKRLELKPYEYPELLRFRDAIRHSYWLHTEFTLTGDIQDWFTKTCETERSALKRTMLAISQVEVAVKTFWARIYDRMPKPEIAEVGMTFAESEVRHSNAYSFLLDTLRLDKDFKRLKDISCINNRIVYLTEIQRGLADTDPRDFILTLLLFSAYVEHISLFSQFLIMMSFNKYKGIFKAISNIVEATSKEEQIHGAFGQEIIRIVRNENPSWFDVNFERKLRESILQAYTAELSILDWIFEEGELNFLPKRVIVEFLKARFNHSLTATGFGEVFDVDHKTLEDLNWFEEELLAKKENDFFCKRSVDYSKKIQSFSEDSLF